MAVDLATLASVALTDACMSHNVRRCWNYFNVRGMSEPQKFFGWCHKAPNFPGTLVCAASASYTVYYDDGEVLVENDVHFVDEPAQDSTARAEQVDVCMHCPLKRFHRGICVTQCVGSRRKTK